MASNLTTKGQVTIIKRNAGLGALFRDPTSPGEI